MSEVRDKFPELYQHLMGTVKIDRENVAAKSSSKDVKEYAKNWWTFGKPRQELRPALVGQNRFIATVDTSKHRIFQFLPVNTICDDKIVIIASGDAWHLGILTSQTHVAWANGQNTRLGQGDDPVYVKSRCFDPFPFPDVDVSTRAKIVLLAEAIDKHRKDVQAAHPEITLTQMYNVLEKMKGEAELSTDERRIFDNALILILKERHDELDAAVAATYGWPADLSDDEILGRLVALNKERAAEEAKGHVRWLRPEYQNSALRHGEGQAGAD